MDLGKQPVDDRQATSFANYRGDQRSILEAGAKGPNYMGEAMWPVTAEYDADANMTRVGFSLMPPPGWAPSGTVDFSGVTQ